MQATLSQILSNKTLPFILLAMASLTLAGCSGAAVGAMGAAAGIYETRPEDGPPADTASQIPPHEVWCYKTAGEPDCYTHPVKDASGRLINVEPQNRYPLSRRGYDEAVVEAQ